MTHRYRTIATICLAGNDEHEIPVVIEYERHRGSSPTMTDPGSVASVSIHDVHIQTGDTLVRTSWMVPLLEEDEGVLAELMEHWTDEDLMAMERRDEDRAERLREDVLED